MLRGIHTAATGMDSQLKLNDTIANNIANVNTTAFKENRANFQDLLYQNIQAPGVASADGVMAPGGVQVGSGSRLISIDRDFSLGASKITNKDTDVMIDGKGFFRIQLPSGLIAYTRDGSLQRSAEGRLVTSKGYPVIPEIVIPPNTENLMIANNGVVTARVSGEEQPRTLGQIEIATFVNENGLDVLGGNLYQASKSSGEPIVTVPGENGTGALTQGVLEASNVNIVTQMINMIEGQRAYELNSKVIRTGDDMLAVANQLKT
jgi:flagellar basal-body rod protein FlgG